MHPASDRQALRAHHRHRPRPLRRGGGRAAPQGARAGRDGGRRAPDHRGAVHRGARDQADDPLMALEARLVEFAELLRQGGVRVSPGEVEDAALALREVGLEPREVVHAALSSTLVKRSRDRETFDRVFDLFFSPSHGFAQELDRSLSRRIEEEGLLEGEERQRLVAELAKLAQGMSPFSRALLAGDGAALASLFRGAAFQFDFSRAGSSLEAGFFARRLLSAAGATGARAELEALERKLGDRGFSEGATGLVSRELSAKLRAVEEAAREYVRAR